MKYIKIRNKQGIRIVKDIEVETKQMKVIICYIMKRLTRQWRSKVPKSGGGGGGTQTRDLCTFGKKKPNINELYLDIWQFTNSHLCQFIVIVHKIINWYMKNAKLLFVSVI